MLPLIESSTFDNFQEFRFCRGKCHKAFKKHRNPRKVKWTKVARKSLKKELSGDLSQSFEKKRNLLFRYERDNLMRTMEAVPKILDIKEKRESAYIRKRLMKGIEQRKAEDIKLVNTQMHLIRAPNAKVKEAKMDVEMNVTDPVDVSMSQLEEEVARERNMNAKKTVKITKKKKLLLST